MIIGLDCFGDGPGFLGRGWRLCERVKVYISRDKLLWFVFVFFFFSLEINLPRRAKGILQIVFSY